MSKATSELLTDILPQVTKVLIIGWRAAEDHFLSMLRDHLSKNAQGLVIAGSEGYASDVIGRLKTANIQTGFRPPKHGFTEFILERQAREFLKE